MQLIQRDVCHIIVVIRLIMDSVSVSIIVSVIIPDTCRTGWRCPNLLSNPYLIISKVTGSLIQVTFFGCLLGVFNHVYVLLGLIESHLKIQGEDWLFL